MRIDALHGGLCRRIDLCDGVMVEVPVGTSVPDIQGCIDISSTGYRQA